MTEDAILARTVETIRSAPMEKLTDSSWLEYVLLPSLGLNDRHLHQMPVHLLPHCGGGIDSWQYPCQFSRYLDHLRRCEPASYAEIGVHKGGTFIITVEFLSRFRPVEAALAVDNWERERMHRYAAMNPAVRYLPTSSQDPAVAAALAERRWDVILIDGDHSYRGAGTDYRLCRPHARRLAFHDIVNVYTPGVQQLWREAQEDHPGARSATWIDQYDDVLLRIRGSMMGIGLIELETGGAADAV